VERVQPLHKVAPRRARAERQRGVASERGARAGCESARAHAGRAPAVRWWPHAQASGRGARRAPVASWLGALPGRRTQRRRRARPDTVARAACRQQARGPRRAALAHSHARGLHAGRAGGAVGMMTARPWHPAFRPAARKQATHIMSGRELVESRIGRCCAFDTLRLRLSFAACPLLHPQPPRCVSARADVSCRTRPGPYALASVRALCGAEFAAAGSCLDEASGSCNFPKLHATSRGRAPARRPLHLQ